MFAPPRCRARAKLRRFGYAESSTVAAAERMYQDKTSGTDSGLGKWLAQSDSGFHPALHAAKSLSGFTWQTLSDLAVGTKLVSCPFDLVISPSACRASLPSFVRQVEHLSDRQLMATYLALHKCVQQDALRHGPYAEALPLPEQLHTPLYFSDSELEVLRGTNLFAATHDRRSEWQKEWQQVTESLVDPAVHLSLQWYLWACTMISYARV